VPVYAPLGAAERISAAYSSENEPVDDVYTFYGLQPGTFPIGPFTVTVDRVNHPIETYGVRVEQGGRVLAYSSDTAPCEALLRLAAGADLFLCEASYLDGVQNPPGLHLTGGEAGEAATKADVAKLLLTHLVPAWGSEASTVESACAAFAGPVEVVRPGSRYDL
jgi:ribonuclease BN (tRNA processing enzyme)